MCIRDRLRDGTRLGHLGAAVDHLDTDAVDDLLGRLVGGRQVHERVAERGLLGDVDATDAVSYTHLRAHETVLDLVCRLLLVKKKNIQKEKKKNTSQRNTQRVDNHKPSR